MAERTAGAVLRDIQQAQAGMKKVRQAMAAARRDPDVDERRLIELGWQGLCRAHKVLAEVPLSAASDEVMTKAIALQRYATALLVRLRRLARHGGGGLDGLEDDDLGDDE
jgi:hypothetical protein